MVGHEFPYSNLHDLNIDWILKIVKDFQTKYEHVDEVFQTTLQQIEEAGENAIQAITENKDTALEAIGVFMQQCIQAIDTKTNEGVTAIDDETSAQQQLLIETGNNARTMVANEGVLQTNRISGLIATLPDTYEDSLNQLQIINATLNGTYNYPPLVQGHYADSQSDDSKTLVADNYRVSTLISSGCASKRLRIQVTNVNGIIRDIIYWTGWGDSAIAHEVPVSTGSGLNQQKTLYTYTFPSNATYFTIVFAYDYDMTQTLAVNDIEVTLQWLFNQLEEITLNEHGFDTSNINAIEFVIPGNTNNSIEEGNEIDEIDISGGTKTVSTSHKLKDTKARQDINSIAKSVYEGKEAVLVNTNNGYISGTTGDIVPPTNNNEKYTDKIAVTEGEVLTVEVQLNNTSNTIWLAYATYDSNEDFIARTDLDTTSIGSTNKTITIANGVSYVSFTYRTYNGASLTITKAWELMDNITNDIDELEESLENKLDNPYFVYSGGFVIGSSTNPNNTDPTRARLTTPLYGIGTLYIKNTKSNGYRFSLRIWSDAPYGTLEYDTGWLTLDDFSYDVEGKYFTIGFSLLPNGTTNIDIDSLNSSSIEITEMSTDESNLVVGILNDVSTLENNVAKLTKEYETRSLTFKSIAHRGDDIIAPQCTAPSYIIAKKNGFTVAENDLWLSEDGYFVMFHDGTLTKLGNLVDINGYLMYTDGTNYYWVNPDDNAAYTWSGTAYIASEVPLGSLTRCVGSNYGVNSTQAQIGLNLDVLKRIDFGVYKGEKFKGTQILTFEEWVMLCKQLGMEIYVDKKMEYTTELLTSAANIVKKCGMEKYASWLGIYSISQIEELRSILPESRIGILQHPAQNWIDAYKNYNTGRGFFFNGDAKTGMTAEAIQLGLNAGFEVEVWFVDVPTYTAEQVYAVIRNAISYGVTGMTLDHYKIEDAFTSLIEQY